MTANVADEKIVPENGLEVRYERYKGIIKNFTLMSDIFMRNVFKQPANKKSRLNWKNIEKFIQVENWVSKLDHHASAGLKILVDN